MASDSQVNGITRNAGIPGGIDDSGDVSLDREQLHESGSVSLLGKGRWRSGRGNDPFIDLQSNLGKTRLNNCLVSPRFVNIFLVNPNFVT